MLASWEEINSVCIYWFIYLISLSAAASEGNLPETDKLTDTLGGRENVTVEVNNVLVNKELHNVFGVIKGFQDPGRTTDEAISKFPCFLDGSLTGPWPVLCWPIMEAGGKCDPPAMTWSMRPRLGTPLNCPSENQLQCLIYPRGGAVCLDPLLIEKTRLSND